MSHSPPEPNKLRLTPPEPDFTPGDKGFDDTDANGFPYDLLGRKGVGKRLSDLIERIDEPLVIALDGGWGTGKSHFLRLWTGAHTKENRGSAKNIYFDAFEHDYLDDPLVGLVGAILQETRASSWSDRAVDRVKVAASKLLRPVARIGLAVATAGATEIAIASLDPVVKAVGEEAERGINALWEKEASRRQAMLDFRIALAELAKDAGGKPQKLVFIVDELDRCRPDYALSLLEVIKHFFSVPNVHFVLGVNLTALENSVRARYGSGIDAAQYLQKFIHLNMILPKIREPNGRGSTALHYLEAVAPKYGFTADMIGEIRLPLEIVYSTREISLRDIQRLVTYTALLPSDFANLEWEKRVVLTGALVLKVLTPEFYHRIKYHNLTLEYFEQLFRRSSQFENDRRVTSFWMVWSNILGGTPHGEALDTMIAEIGRVPHNDYRLWLDRFVAEHIDAFDFPQKP